MPEIMDPRMISVTPRIRYNTIGGVNGPLVILDNVRSWRGEAASQ
jgi:V-type H+-transporting ATPase subunit B